MKSELLMVVLLIQLLGGLFAKPLHIILTPDEASKILTREAQEDFQNGIKKFLNTKVDVKKTVYSQGAPGLPQDARQGAPGLPSDARSENIKRSELLGKIKNLLNELSSDVNLKERKEEKVSAFYSPKNGVILKDRREDIKANSVESNSNRQDKAKMAPALPHADASDAGGPTKPNKKQDSLAVLEKMVDDLVKEVQGERKRVVAPKEDIATQPNKQHQDKIISPGKRQKIISSGKRGGEPQDSKPIGFGRQAVKLIGVGREVSHSNVGQETLRKLEDLVQKIKRENKRDFVSNDLSNIERSLENRVSSDEKLVESTATKREEKKTEETSSEKPKDRRTLLNELLDTYNEVIGKKSRKTDKYAKELEVESQSISPKGKVSKETAKDLAGFSINGKRESEKSAKLSAEDIINKAREVLNEGFTHKGKPVPK